MVSIAFPISEAAIAEYCQRHGIHRLALFGSVLRDDFGPDSDIDVLVDFAPEVSVGWRIVDIEAELSDLLGGRTIDMVRTSALNSRLRDPILASAQVLYEKR